MVNEFSPPIVSDIVPPEKGTFQFETVYEPDKNYYMDWTGSAQDALAGLRSGADEISEMSAHTYWNSGRVVRTIIDSDVSGEDRVDLIQEATAVALETYTNGVPLDHIDRLEQKIRSKGSLNEQVEQLPDDLTTLSSQVEYSRRCAERIAQKVPDTPTLFIPICHGGFSAGVQTALYVHQHMPESETLIYPVRYSTQKLLDTEPLLTSRERDLIREAAREHAIVVFDEDTCTGFSVGNFVEYLDNKLPRSTTIIGVVNQDFRPIYEKREQGTWWEGRRQTSSTLRTFFDTITFRK